MIDQKDRYVGKIDPITKQRHGEGTYYYKDENPCFQYQGHWQNGIKHTEPGQQSTFTIREGPNHFTQYIGEFNNGEITGFGVKKWSDGKAYRGEFLEGEMHGNGSIVYNSQSFKQQDMSYEGQFHLNSREGLGVLTKKNGDIYNGNFRNNQPNGEVEIKFANGDEYQGNVINGEMTGNGYLKQWDGQSFKGQFNKGKLDGQGSYFIENGTYIFESEYKDGVSIINANKFLVKVLSPVEEKEEVKDKKDVKKVEIPTQDNKINNNDIKIQIDNANQNEAQRKLGIELQIVFQGEPYEDHSAPEEEETVKGKPKPKGKETVEVEAKMITPEPIILTKENGREFEIELGRIEQVKIDKNTINGSSHNVEQIQKAGDSLTALEPDEGESVTENRWIQYKLDQNDENENILRLVTQNGIAQTSKLLSFKLDEKFQSGTYDIIIKDITKGLTDKQRLGQVKIEFKIFDSNLDAEMVAAQAAATKGKKK